MITNTGDLCEGSVHLSTLSHNVTDLAARIATVETMTSSLQGSLDQVSI